MAGKQAPIIPEKYIKMALALCETRRYSARDRVMIMLSHYAGLRACEIGRIKWEMMTGADGELLDEIHLEDSASKMGSGRVIAIHPDLYQELTRLGPSEGPVILSERRNALKTHSIVNFFWTLYRQLGLKRGSSHSGRRTFATKGAKRIIEHGGSLRDIQQLLGHKSLQTTQRYIEGSEKAKQNFIKSL